MFIYPTGYHSLSVWDILPKFVWNIGLQWDFFVYNVILWNHKTVSLKCLHGLGGSSVGSPNLVHGLQYPLGYVQRRLYVKMHWYYEQKTTFPDAFYFLQKSSLFMAYIKYANWYDDYMLTEIKTLINRENPIFWFSGEVNACRCRF